MAKHFNCFPTFRHLNLVVCNVVLKVAMRDSCALVVTIHLNYFRAVSGWDESGPRNVGFCLYFSTRDEPLF